MDGWDYLALVLFLNVTLFLIVAMAIGGSALNGKIEYGHYYLGEHGRFTEVSVTTYRYSEYHEFLFFVSFPVLMVLALRGLHRRLDDGKKDSLRGRGAV